VSEEIQTGSYLLNIKTRHGFEEKEGINRDSMIIGSSSVVATGGTKIDLRRSSSNSNIGNETNNGKTTIHSKMLRAQNKHELSKTISLAKKEVNESNVIKVTRNEINPCNNNEMKLYIARLDYLAEKQEDDIE
jgi:hypothetical protein